MEFFKKYRNTILKYAFLLFLMFFTVYLVFKNLDINSIDKIKNIIDKKYIAIGVCAILLYIILEGIILKQIVDAQYKVKARFLGMKLATMGFYYNLVTPFASGSQPMQIYALNKYDINLSKSIAIVTNKTVLFQTVVTIYSAVIIFLNIEVLKNELPSMLVLMSIGMVMNIVSLLGGMLIVLTPNTMKIIVKVIVNILYRLNIFKSLNKKIHTINKFIDEYSYSIKLFIKNKKALCLSIILTIIQLTVFFSISYCVYKAFNLNGLSLFEVLSLQVFLYMSVSPIPTPGNVGANEVAFLTIFANVFPGNIIGYSVFLYSIYVYYFLVVVCGLFTIHTHYHMNKRKNKNRNYSL